MSAGFYASKRSEDCCTENGCLTWLENLAPSAFVNGTYTFSSTVTAVLRISLCVDAFEGPCFETEGTSTSTTSTVILVNFNGDQMILGQMPGSGESQFVSFSAYDDSDRPWECGDLEIATTIAEDTPAEFSARLFALDLDQQADVDSDGSFTADDARLLHDLIMTSSTGTLPGWILTNLDIDPTGSTTSPVVDFDDLRLLMQLAAGFSSTIVMGDANDDGQRNWCDVSTLSDLISLGSVLISDAQYDPVLDMNFDGLLNATDLDEIRAGLIRRQGDATGDGDVDFDDHTAVVAAWGTSPGPWGYGDANGDGEVDFDDINAVMTYWSHACD